MLAAIDQWPQTEVKRRALGALQWLERKRLRIWTGDSRVRQVEPGTTYLTTERLLALERHLRSTERKGVVGDVVECGVAAGGSAALMASWLTRHRSGRKLVLFDTFEGLPAPSAEDPDYDRAVAWTGKCLGTLQDVQQLMQRHGVDAHRVEYVPGLFQATIPEKAPAAIALAHLDGDWYDSTKWCLDHLWPRIGRGGRVQIDDYGTWQGCRKATDEFLASHSSVRVHVIDEAIWLEKP